MLYTQYKTLHYIIHVLAASLQTMYCVYIQYKTHLYITIQTVKGMFIQYNTLHMCNVCVIIVKTLLPNKYLYKLWRVCLSAVKSHIAGGARPVLDSLMPLNSFTFFTPSWMSFSITLMASQYMPEPWMLLVYFVYPGFY